MAAFLIFGGWCLGALMVLGLWVWIKERERPRR